MVAKKSPEANLEKKKSLYVMLGFVMVLSLIYIVFEWSQKDLPTYDRNQYLSNFVDDIVLPPPTTQTPPPPPPPRPVEEFKIVSEQNKYPLKQLIVVVNKIDLISEGEVNQIRQQLEELNVKLATISAKEKSGIDTLKEELLSLVNTGALRNNETIVTNTRHYDSLLKALEEIQKVKWGLDSGISSDLMAIDIRSALHYFGEITGEVTNDELLGNIFSNFCIGK